MALTRRRRYWTAALAVSLGVAATTTLTDQRTNRLEHADSMDVRPHAHTH
jgi:hypothetical protein